MDTPIFKSDIPNDKWLAEKRSYALEDGRNRFGVLKTFGPITGSFNRVLHLPVSELRGVPGEHNEQTNVRSDSLRYIKDNFARVAKEPVYVEVDPLGAPWVNEGNHRIMAAAAFGVKYLPVQVRYFSGGERKANTFAPEILIGHDFAYQNEVSINNRLIENLEQLVALGYESQAEYDRHQELIKQSKSDAKETTDTVFSLPGVNVDSGLHSGTIVFVSNGSVGQKINRLGDVVIHDAARLSAAIKARDVVDIKYVGGVGIVSGMDKDVGVAR